MAIKFLIGVWACAAFLSNAEPLRVSGTSSSVSHSTPQDLYSGNDSANAQQSYDKADQGTSDFAGSDERAGGTSKFMDELQAFIKQSKNYLNPSTSVETSQLREQFLSRASQYIAQKRDAGLRNVKMLVRSLIEENDLGLCLQDLLQLLVTHDETKEFAKMCVISLVHRFIGGWLTSRKNPAEVLEYLRKFAPDQTPASFIESDLLNPLLSYYALYGKEATLTENVLSASKLIEFVYPSMDLFIAKAYTTTDGAKFVKSMTQDVSASLKI